MPANAGQPLHVDRRSEETRWAPLRFEIEWRVKREDGFRRGHRSYRDVQRRYRMRAAPAAASASTTGQATISADGDRRVHGDAGAHLAAHWRNLIVNRTDGGAHRIEEQAEREDHEQGSAQPVRRPASITRARGSRGTRVHPICMAALMHGPDCTDFVGPCRPGHSMQGLEGRGGKARSRGGYQPSRLFIREYAIAMPFGLATSRPVSVRFSCV